MKIVVVLNDKNVVQGYYGKIPTDSVKSGIEFETDIDLNSVDIIDNYKLENGKLTKLTEEEKESLAQTKESIEQLLSSLLLENAEIKKQLKEQQELSSNLMLQIAKLKGDGTNV